MKVNKKAILAVAVTLLLAAALFVGAGAADTWDGSTAASFAGGTGTQADPYQIATGAQLAFLAQKVNASDAKYTSAYYKLTADIDLQDKEWTPIGESKDANKVFKGHFDGQNHTISNLFINQPEKTCLGLFGVMYATGNSSTEIKNLNVHNVKITGLSTIGTVVGYVDYCKFTIKNCHVTGLIQVSGTGTGEAACGADKGVEVGGLVGTVMGNSGVQDILIEECTVIGSEFGSEKSFIRGTNMVGGLAGGGSGHAPSPTIKNCLTYIDVQGNKKLGGLIGQQYYGNAAQTLITGSSSYGNIIIEDETKEMLGECGSYGTLVGCIVGDVSGIGTHVIISNSNSYGSIVGWGNIPAADAVSGDDKKLRLKPGLIGAYYSASTDENITTARDCVKDCYFYASSEDAEKLAKVTGTTDKLYAGGTLVTGATPVAQIGSKQYYTLQDAVDAANDNDTITLLRNITYNYPTGPVFKNGVYGQGDYSAKKLTLNLNGKTISAKIDNTFTGSSRDLFFNGDRGDLTVTGNGKIEITDSNDTGWSSSMSIFGNTGKLTIENGTFENKGQESMSYVVDNRAGYNGGNAELIVNGGTLSCPDYTAVRLWDGVPSGDVDSQKCLVTINGGEISGKRCFFLHQPSAKAVGYSTLTVTGGKMTATQRFAHIDVSGLVDRTCIDISGGEISVQGTAGNAVFHVDIVYAASPVNGSAKVTITDAKIKANGNPLFEQVSGKDTALAGAISGGVFDCKPDAAYIAPGYDCIKNTDSATKDDYPHKVAKPVITVTFDKNGDGAKDANPKTIDEIIGNTYTLPTTDPTWVGHTFDGWFTDATGGTQVTTSTTVTSAEAHTLYAHWTLNFYVAKLADYTFGDSALPKPYIDPDDPEGPTDVTFFYSSSANGVEIPWSSITSTTDLDAGTWYIGADDNTDAGFDIHRSTFTVAKAEQNAPSFSAKAVEDGIQISISGFDPKKTYYYSVEKSGEKWMIASEQSITVSGLDAVTPYLVKVKVGAKGNYNESPAAEQTVTTGSSFSVSYNANGGVGSIPSQTGYDDTPVIVSSAEGISRDGYTFTTWNTQPDGKGTSYAEGAPIETGAVLYAQWNAQTYTVYFDGNGGTADPDHLTEIYGTTVDLSQVTATHNGNQVHVGWAKSPGAKSALYTPKQQVQNLGAGTLYAVWMPEAKVCHDLSVKVDDGVYVELRQGSSVIKSATSTGGQVTFGEIPEGIYNLVAIKNKDTDQEKTVTREVSLTKDTELKDIVFPDADVNSKVVIEDAKAETGAPATPAIVVGSVDEEAVANAEDGKFVTVTVNVTATTPAEVTPESTLAEQEVQQDIIKIQAEAKSKGIMEQQYLGITVTKTVKESGEETKESKLTSTENKLEFIIPYDFTGKPTVTLFRCHDGVATELESLPKRPSVEDRRDGTYFLDRSSDMIYLYASEFSTYSIAYSTEAPKPVSHGSSPSGTSVWATPTPTPAVPATEPTPGETPGAADVPGVKPIETPSGSSAKTPAPFIGILAGLGAAAVVFGLRRK